MHTDAWKGYEGEIEEYLRSQYPDASISHDTKVVGVVSKTNRQIDVLVETHSLDFPLRIVVEGRRHKRRIDITAIEAFVTKLKDVQAHVGVLVSPAGYTSGAKAAAKAAGADIYLETLTPAELKAHQGTVAIPYSNHNAACISAPLGWIVDGSKEPGTLARLYRRGLDQQSAIEKREFMYINFWTKTHEVGTLPQLLDHQAIYLRKCPSPSIMMQATPKRKEPTAIRRFTRADYPHTVELTGFVEFEAFILMAVLIGPIDQLKESLRRVRYVIRTAIPMYPFNVVG
jgi:restriction endonuclease